MALTAEEGYSSGLSEALKTEPTHFKNLPRSGLWMATHGSSSLSSAWPYVQTSAMFCGFSVSSASVSLFHPPCVWLFLVGTLAKPFTECPFLHSLHLYPTDRVTALQHRYNHVFPCFKRRIHRISTE